MYIGFGLYIDYERKRHPGNDHFFEGWGSFFWAFLLDFLAFFPCSYVLRALALCVHACARYVLRK